MPYACGHEIDFQRRQSLPPEKMFSINVGSIFGPKPLRNDNENLTNAQQIVTDSLMNARTVQALGIEKALVEMYMPLVLRKKVMMPLELLTYKLMSRGSKMYSLGDKSHKYIVLYYT